MRKGIGMLLMIHQEHTIEVVRLQKIRRIPVPATAHAYHHTRKRDGYV